MEILKKLANLDCTCRTGCKPPDCKIRQCTQKKGVEVCPQYNEYPCTLIQKLAEHYPTLIQDGKCLQTIGLKELVKEQDERSKRGVVYADIRTPYET